MRYWVKLGKAWAGPFITREEAEEHGSDIWFIEVSQARAWVRD